jgi:hypothetical protein
MSKLNPSEIKTRMAELAQTEGDTEEIHILADDLLCQLAEVSGFPDIVELYRKVHKWYA